MSKSVKLEDATADQLRLWCMMYLGQSMPPNTKPETMAAKLRAIGHEEFEVEENAGGAVAERLPSSRGAGPAPNAPQTVEDYLALYPKGVPDLTGMRDPPVIMMIPHQDKEGGQRPVFVGVNGTSYTIPRGKNVSVPWRYYLALKDAVEATYQPDPNDHYSLIRTDTPSYPIQVVQLPPKAWVLAWEQAQGIGRVDEGDGDAMDPAILALLERAHGGLPTAA